jgi:gliding motility-associated-like protein
MDLVWWTHAIEMVNNSNSWKCISKMIMHFLFTIHRNNIFVKGIMLNKEKAKVGMKAISGVILVLFSIHVSTGQSYFIIGTQLYKTNFDEAACSCSSEYIAPAMGTGGFTFTPDSILVNGGSGFLYEIDTLTGDETLIFIPPPLPPPQYWLICDTASIGISQVTFDNMQGCDSLVITTIIAGVADTNYLYGTSCDSSSLGIFESHITTTQQCDSLVITTITYAAQDSTFLFSASCDPAAAGIFVTQWTNQFGCESIVTATVSLLPTSETFITSTTCDPALAGDFDHLLINQYGCDSLVHETITLLPWDATLLHSTTCTASEAGIFVTALQNQYGCDSILTLAVTLVSADTAMLLFNTCDPDESGMVQHTYTNQEGCDSLVIEITSLYPLSTLNIISTSVHNEYDISCTGANDGSIIADMIGTSPYAYTWSTGCHDQALTGIVAGDYAVTVVDGNGCEVVGSIILVEPTPLMITFIISQPDCFDQSTGYIVVVSAGSVAPIQYAIHGFNYQISPVFDGLESGMYVISALDANNCSVEEIIILNAPLSVSIELGEDQYINAGDSAIIQAVVNVPYDSLTSLHWSELPDAACPTCLMQTVVPIITSTYTVSVTTVDGCMDADSLTLYLERQDDVYVPNVFSPNGDGINDLFLISASADIEEIEHLSIYDRWGNMIFLNEHFLPNDPGEAWDGKWKGETLNPGVFAYKMIARFSNERSEIRYGDATLMRYFLPLQNCQWQFFSYFGYLTHNLVLPLSTAPVCFATPG